MTRDDIRVIEGRMVPAIAEGPGGDRLVESPHVLGVLDAATAKPWDTGGLPGVSDLADCMARALGDLDQTSIVHDAVGAATQAVAALHRACGVPPGSAGCVVFAVVNSYRRELWRVGDVRVVVGGVERPPNSTAEGIVARARALVLQSCLAEGEPIALLRGDDVGRRAVEPLLRAATALRNHTAGRWGYAAIDGTAVPPEMIEVFPLPDEGGEVVLATDGYPGTLLSLEAAEASLAERLHRDPLMIADPPATKGWTPGDASFDDRAYLRLWVPPVRELHDSSTLGAPSP